MMTPLLFRKRTGTSLQAARTFMAKSLRLISDGFGFLLGSRKLYALLAVVALYYAVTNRENLANVLDDYTQFRTSGKIYIDSPEVYTRERLVNDRYEQAVWLRDEMARLDAGSYLSTRISDSTRRTTDLTLRAKEGDKTAGESAGDTNGSNGTGAAGAALPQLEKMPFDLEHEIKAATRDKIRQSIIENMLDDRHDLIGNTLVALKFDTTVIPNRSVERRAFVEVSLDTGNIAFKYDDVMNEFPSEKNPILADCKARNQDQRVRWEVVLYLCGKYYDILSDQRTSLGKINDLYTRWLKSIENRLNASPKRCDSDPQTKEETRRAVEDGLGARMIDVLDTAADGQTQADARLYRVIVEPPWRDIVEILGSCTKGALTFQVGSLTESFIIFDDDIKNLDACNVASKPRECGDYTSIYAAYTSNLLARYKNRSTGQTGHSDAASGTSLPPSMQAVFDLITNGVIIAKTEEAGGQSSLIIKAAAGEQDNSIARNFTAQIKYKISSDGWSRLGELSNYANTATAGKQDATKYTIVRYDSGECANLRKNCLLYGFPSGFFNFIGQVSRMDSFAYSLMPTNRSSAIYAARSLADRVSFGMAPAGDEAAAISSEAFRSALREGFSSETEGIGYGIGEKDANRITFGWVMNVSAVGGARQHSQTALLSIPAWLEELKLKVRKGWLNHDGSEREVEEVTEIPVPLPFDDEVLDTYVANDFRYRKPRIISSKAPGQKISAAIGGTVIIPGDRLWRSSVVLLQGRKAKSLLVLPDMRGLMAEFDGPFPVGPLSLVVWTSEDMIQTDGLVVAVDDAKPAPENLIKAEAGK
ncbi:hypothetical protein GR138_13520 [Shinella kummerowiae]|uniref:Uncharacterized protein n=1 Tax=Shinella kummerowiae TaxID=417745 RepID=A0A6N8SH53_9HYPH|nr:hypothetical protein [Shinella kummerowiae]MXN46212.1 hypothetical protein [Shinella kummerowiae]